MGSRALGEHGRPTSAGPLGPRRTQPKPGRHTAEVIRAVVFDLDGVLLDSESLWDDARRQVVARYGGHWREQATADMQGMSSLEWSNYLRNQLGVELDEAEIGELVVDILLDRYRRALPLLQGARDAVARIGGRWPLGLASSSNRVVIEEVLTLSGLASAFQTTVSSEEVRRGKPYPDVYLEAARRLGLLPQRCVAVEDSTNGIDAAIAAGLRVVAVPNRDFPPKPEVVASADLVLASLEGLTLEALDRLDDRPANATFDQVDEEEIESFPASDPPSDWPGPAG